MLLCLLRAHSISLSSYTEELKVCPHLPVNQIGTERPGHCWFLTPPLCFFPLLSAFLPSYLPAIVVVNWDIRSTQPVA